MKAAMIGCGNLGESFIRGLIKSEVFDPEDIIGSDLDIDRLERIEELGANTTDDNKEAAKEPEIIFLAIKPSIVGKVLKNLELSDEKLLVSLAAGVSTGYIQDFTEARVIRVMPNICGSVAEMASGYTPGKNATKDDEKLIEEILNEMGETVKVSENLMDTVTGLSGGGPAFIFLIIKALKEAGIEGGLNENDAQKLAAQTVKGSGELVLNSNKKLDKLIDMVCSPKGTTIEGVKVLEEKEVLKSLKEAVMASKKRSEELTR